VRAGRVTRVAEFGAFVELEPGVEALAHASTFEAAGQSGRWSRAVAPGTTGAFEILSIDPEKKRIGVALVPEGSARARGTEPSEPHDSPTREDAAPPEGFGSMADKLRGALTPREK
jgi:small subunit ribosomal protein S1